MVAPFQCLIIDDSEKDALLVSRKLRKEWPNLSFERVESAAALRKALEEQHWDCVICDMVIPGFGAPAALEIFKERQLNLPFIVVSGVLVFDDAIRLIKIGAHDFIRKDNLSRLIPALKRARRDVENHRKHLEAEETLRLSEARFRTIFEQAPLGVALMDSVTGHIHEANPRFAAIAGRTLQEMVNVDWISLTHPLDRQEELDHMALLCAGKSPGFTMNKRLRRSDGSCVWINMTVAPVTVSDKGGPSHLCMIDDITERRQREARLEVQTRRDEALLELPRAAETLSETSFLQRGLALLEELTGSRSSFIYVVRDGDETLEKATWSHRTLSEYGQVNPRTHGFLWDPDTWAQALQQRRTVMVNNDFSPPHDRRVPEGYLELRRLISLPVIENGTVVMLTGVGNKETDYTDFDRETVQLISNEIWRIVQRRQTEIQLRKLAQAVEQSPESIVITNLDAEIEYVNEAFIHRTGYSRKEVLGRNPRFLQSGKTPRDTYWTMWDALTHGRPWRGEMQNRRKDGSEYTEFALVTPLHQPNGPVTHYVGVKEDITEKKRLARELDKYRYQLEELVKKRTAQLAETQERADAANRAKSSFLANMSHEIRTPMNAIVGLTHLLQRSKLTSEQSERLSKLDAAARHLLSIINDILDLSKIEAGKLALTQSNFHLGMLFEQIQALLREPARRKGLTLKTNLTNVPRWLRGDPTRLRQALINYASNAIRFSEQGSIVLCAKMVDVQEDALLIRFEVRDSGIGIEPDTLPRLFQTFEQADSSRTRKFGGTGLGLAINRSLARLMGGEAGAESEPGQGSCFWFTARLHRGYCDLSGAPPPDIRDAELALRNQHHGAAVLLVEDDAVNREVAVELMTGVGITVDTADNGRDAVKKTRSTAYDLVLMDIHMPELDGLAATRMIRTFAGQTHLPILAMTASAFEEDRQTCLEAGMNDFIAKPVDPENLFRVIVKWLPDRGTSMTPPPGDCGLNKRSDASSAEDPAQMEGLLSGKILSGNSGRGFEAHLRLVRLFDAAHREDIPKLRAFLQKGLLAEAQRLLHGLKGAAGTLGLSSLYDGARHLEALLHGQSGPVDFKELPQIIDRLHGEQERLHRVLAKLDSHTTSDQGVGLDAHRVKCILDRLHALLATSDTEANALFLASEGLLMGAFGASVTILGAQIEAYDYPEALMTLELIQQVLVTRGPQPSFSPRQSRGVRPESKPDA